MSFICEKCKKSISTKSNYIQHIKTCDFSIEKKQAIDDLYFNKKKSPREIAALGYSKALIKKTLDGRRRSVSESLMLFAQKNPGRHLTDDTKRVLSTTMKSLYKQGKIKRWNISRRQRSYAEQKFFDYLIDLGYKYEDDFFTEFPFGLFHADFYFPKKALVIEIDGAQHLKRKETDKRKDEFINSKNIKVFRILWKAMCHNSKEQFDNITQILMKPDQDVILQFTNAQLEKMNRLNEHKKQKTENFKLRLQQKIDQRRNDYLIIEKKQGWITKLGEKWGISHTQVSRFIKYKFENKAG